MPSINQETGTLGSEPGETLKTFRSDRILLPNKKSQGQVGMLCVDVVFRTWIKSLITVYNVWNWVTQQLLWYRFILDRIWFVRTASLRRRAKLFKWEIQYMSHSSSHQLQRLQHKCSDFRQTYRIIAIWINCPSVDGQKQVHCYIYMPTNNYLLA